MPSKKAKEKPKALVISNNKSIKSAVRFILGDVIVSQVSRSAPDGKQLFKNSTNIGILVLDWSLQDRHNSIFKCLVEAKARKNVFVINVFGSQYQKDSVYQRLPNLRKNKRVYSVFLDFWSISLSITLLMVKTRINPKL